MGRKRTKPAEKTTGEDRMHPVVRDLTGQILAAAESLGWTREKLGQMAGRESGSTFYAWRNGTRTPNLVELEEYAKAVGLHVRLVSDSADSHGQPGEPKVNERIKKLVAQLEGLSDEALDAFADDIARYRRIWGPAPSPRAAADEPGAPGRSSNS